VSFRPYLIEFLEKTSQNFELVLYTASNVSSPPISLCPCEVCNLNFVCLFFVQEIYADEVIKLFDPEDKYFSHRLYRQHCLQVSESLYVKDLSRLGRDLSKTIIVDNSIHAFGYQITNGVPIPSFYGQTWDHELQMLVSILKARITFMGVVPSLSRHLRPRSLSLPLLASNQQARKVFPSGVVSGRWKMRFLGRTLSVLEKSRKSKQRFVSTENLKIIFNLWSAMTELLHATWQFIKFFF